MVRLIEIIEPLPSRSGFLVAKIREIWYKYLCGKARAYERAMEPPAPLIKGEYGCGISEWHTSYFMVMFIKEGHGCSQLVVSGLRYIRK